MDSKKELFDVEFTVECIEELIEIYEYICNNLKEDNAAKRLITEVIDKVLNLSESPELYMKVGKVDKLKNEYHRIVVKNYSVFYTIDFDRRKVFIAHVMYGRRNFL